MTNTLSEQEIWHVLRAIEQGEITLVPHAEPQAVYAGNVVYCASNGWEIWVFNDCNAWDYLDSIMTNDGRAIDFDALQAIPSLADYQPSDEVAWSRYRIPGYLQMRCTQCGGFFEERGEETKFLCTACLLGIPRKVDTEEPPTASQET